MQTRGIGKYARWVFNTLGIVKEFGESLVYVPSDSFGFVSNTCLFCFSASVLRDITDEQASFLRKFWDIPFEEKKWKDLVTLVTFHAFYGGPEPTLVAQRLHATSRHHKFSDPSFYLISTF